jgi:hypothetical protein
MMRAELKQLTKTRKSHIIDYNESNARKPGTSPNTVFTHRGIRPSVPEVKSKKFMPGHTRTT